MFQLFSYGKASHGNASTSALQMNRRFSEMFGAEALCGTVFEATLGSTFDVRQKRFAEATTKPVMLR